MMTSPILKDFPNSQTPWQPRPELLARSESSPDLPFRQVEVLPSDPEKDFVLKCFSRQKPPDKSIVKITYLHNSAHQTAFEAELQSMEQEGKIFPPEWENEPLPSLNPSCVKNLS